MGPDSRQKNSGHENGRFAPLSSGAKNENQEIQRKNAQNSFILLLVHTAIVKKKQLKNFF